MGITPAIIGASAIGAGAQIFGAQTGASAQRDAANQATQTQLQMFERTRADLQPFISGGTSAFRSLQDLTGTGAGGNPLTAPLTRKFQPTMAELEQTPGYQFTRDQGLKAAQNAYSAKGLGSSGAATKGAVDYASGLASTTYQTQFDNYLRQNQQIFNMLMGETGVGQSSAAGVGAMGTQVGSSVGGNIIGAGNATAAANVASGNAFAGIPNSFMQMSMLNRLTGDQTGWSGGGGGGGYGEIA